MEIQNLGRYQVRARIGRGTMGIVYRGYDPVLEREIALKTVDLSPAMDESGREAFLARFFQEARIAAKLLHPNIVVTHDASTDAQTGIPFIAMELVPGGSLLDRIEREGRLGWREAARLVLPIARALDYAHREGVVHRDVKPANVLLTSAGHPKIADFGIAKLSDSQLTQTGAVLGTPYYMSPEQLEADEVDGRSDLFSLGSLLYALLVGHPPFRGPDLATITRQVLHKNPEPPSELVPGLPEELDGLVARALAKRPEDRYATGGEIAEDLERVTRGEAPARPLALGERTLEARLPERKRSSFGAGCLLAVLAAAVGAGVLWFHWDEAANAIRETKQEQKRSQELVARASETLDEARAHLGRGRWDDAGKAIERALELSRQGNYGAGEAEALLLRGVLRAENGEWSAARADLDSAASVFEIYDELEGRAKAIVELANLERDLGAFERARSLYERVEGIDKARPEAILGNALSSLMQGDFQSAERGFRSVHESGDATLEARARAALYLGTLAVVSDRSEDAARFWAEAREGLDSDEVDLFRGYAALAAGNTEESKALFEASASHLSASDRALALVSAREGLAGRTASGPLQTIFLGEPRTKRSEERRQRLPAAIALP